VKSWLEGLHGCGERDDRCWEKCNVGKNFHFIILCYRKGEKWHASLRKGWELRVKDTGSSDLPFYPPPPPPPHLPPHREFKE